MDIRSTLFDKRSWPSWLFFASVLAVSILVGVLSKPYFAERVFSMNGSKYKLADVEDGIRVYESGESNAPIRVSGDDGHRVVSIEGASYEATRTSAAYTSHYDVVYPDGKRYDVEAQRDTYLIRDDKGNYVSDLAVYSNGQRVLSEGELLYSPAAIVIAAYPEYHDKRGEPWKLWAALALFVFGWCNFRYRKLQTAAFWLSPRNWIYTENPEPNDFHYFMCKVAGIAAMGFGIYVAFTGSRHSTRTSCSSRRRFRPSPI